MLKLDSSNNYLMALLSRTRIFEFLGLFLALAVVVGGAVFVLGGVPSVPTSYKVANTHLEKKSEIKNLNPDDKIIFDNKRKKKDQGPSNLTDILNDKLIEKSLAVGVNLDDQLDGLGQDQLSTQEIQQVFEQDSTFAWPEISPDDLKILDNNSRQTTLDYLTGLVSLAKQIFPEHTLEQDSLEVAINAVANADYDDLDSHIRFYQNFSKELYKLPVPSDLLGIHQDYIASTILTNQILKAFRNHEQDPIKTVIALQEYQNIEAMTEDIAQKLATIIEQNEF